MSRICNKINEAIEFGETEEVVELVEEALDNNEDPLTIMNEGLIGGMNIVGDLFKQGEIFVPEVLMSANAMDAGMELIKPFLSENDIKKKGKVIFCTVKGDLHDIGKKLCIMMLEGAGYEVVDLGVDIGVEQIVKSAKEHNPDIIAMSAMLTTTMITMDEAVEALENGGFANVQIMVGGAPLSASYADNIRANYSEDAITAVTLANKLLH